ncbi:1,6-anhydro-N-acetylmuramyl-L-alanine amidase AmpD [Endothiovibrio diazotrophicus]
MVESTVTTSDDGWLQGARRVASPNCDERPAGERVSLLVIHNISLPPGEFGGPYIDRLFTNTLDPEDHPFFAEIHALRVSSHLLIRRDGELVQYVPLAARAWHAGTSSFHGRERCNDYSIGIELEGGDEVPYRDAQYARLAEVTAAIRAAYPAITAERITGHADIAPGRKTDPGPAFDWHRYLASIR